MAFSVRMATDADYPVFCRLVPELAVPDPVPSAEDFAAMLPRIVILEEDGAALGYAFWQIYGKATHVVHVVVDPRARGRRGGEALLGEVRRRATRAGCTRWSLNVKQDNRAAIRLYERCGFSVVQEGWGIRTTWVALASIPGAGHRLTVHPLVDATDDRTIATLFGIEVERIAHLRARPREVLLILRNGEEIVAFAGFAPAYPGIYPIRVKAIDLARPLFDALRPYAAVDHVYLSVEGDRPLFELLQAHGATLEHAMFRMHADIR
jgi:GNAT superfamily N-acetyltransferase